MHGKMDYWADLVVQLLLVKSSIAERSLLTALNMKNIKLKRRLGLIGNFFTYFQLQSAGDPAWECLQIEYSRLLKMMDECRDDHVQR